ncbi:hypothetical protein NPIL_152791 [Nephila pilipes]|uniref:Uncharacterized protein n=1 Tax=Nephila pilipes TaxID=299642 RepID=A0A8X6MPQ5_NEPPI|nr:hypothetical protein NPIL_152791 [Nephila pilipes]
MFKHFITSEIRSKNKSHALKGLYESLRRSMSSARFISCHDEPYVVPEAFYVPGSSSLPPTFETIVNDLPAGPSAFFISFVLCNDLSCSEHSIVSTDLVG